MPSISIHEYFWDPAAHPVGELCAVFGDDAFLKRHAVRLLRDHVLDGEDAEFSLTRFEGSSATLNDVLKEVATRAMFGGDRRLVLVEDADPFVSKYRAELEDYADRPSANGLLVLQMNTFPSNTKLFKKVAARGLAVEAKALPEKELPQWIIRWAKHQHKVDCNRNAADLLLERIGSEHGLLDQELAKLALMVPAKGRITTELVEKAIGSLRSQPPYMLLNAALSGETAAAIRQLDQMLLSGEKPPGILGMIAKRLRMFAAATQRILDAEKNGRKLSVSAALKQSGVNYYMDEAEKQLKRLGRVRGMKLLDWLLQADLDLKGDSRGDKRIILEKLIVQIADSRLRGR